MSLLIRKNGSGAADVQHAWCAAASVQGRAGRQERGRGPLSSARTTLPPGPCLLPRTLERSSGSADDAAARAVPLAKNAGAAVRQRADDAAAWAGPHVQDARAWAAPHVEQAGIAVQEKLAPQVSDMLTKAARQLDPAPKSRRRSRLAAAVALLAAAASAAAVVALLRRRGPPGRGRPSGRGRRDGRTGTGRPGQRGGRHRRRGPGGRERAGPHDLTQDLSTDGPGQLTGPSRSSSCCGSGTMQLCSCMNPRARQRRSPARRRGGPRSSETRWLLAAAASSEVPVAVAFLSGELRQRQIGVAAAATAALGDLSGNCAASDPGWLRGTKRPSRPRAADGLSSHSEPSLTLADTDAAFAAIGAVLGQGAQAERRQLLAALLSRATEGERAFLIRLLAGDLRQGALEGIMTEAIARAAGVPAGLVRRAHQLGGSLPEVAQAALGEPGEPDADRALAALRSLHAAGRAPGAPDARGLRGEHRRRPGPDIARRRGMEDRRNPDPGAPAGPRGQGLHQDAR